MRTFIRLVTAFVVASFVAPCEATAQLGASLGPRISGQSIALQLTTPNLELEGSIAADGNGSIFLGLNRLASPGVRVPFGIVEVAPPGQVARTIPLPPASGQRMLDLCYDPTRNAVWVLLDVGTLSPNVAVPIDLATGTAGAAVTITFSTRGISMYTGGTLLTATGLDTFVTDPATGATTRNSRYNPTVPGVFARDPRTGRLWTTEVFVTLVLRAQEPRPLGAPQPNGGPLVGLPGTPSYTGLDLTLQANGRYAFAVMYVDNSNGFVERWDGEYQLGPKCGTFDYLDGPWAVDRGLWARARDPGASQGVLFISARPAPSGFPALPGGCRIFFDPSTSIALPMPLWLAAATLPFNPPLYNNLPLWTQVVTLGASGLSVSEGRLIAVRQ